MKNLLKGFMFTIMTLVLVACGANEDEGSEGAGEEASVEQVKVALVTDAVGTEQFIVQAVNALEAQAKEKGFEVSIMETADNSMYLEKGQAAAEEGFDLVIGLGWASAEPFSELADMYEDIHFAVIDTTASNDQVSSIAYNEAEGAYILGAMVATAFPEDDFFGYVSSFQNYASYKYRWGFEEGLLTVNPDVEVMYNFTDSFSDTNKVYEFALQQAAAGANFIMGGVAASANEGLYQAALELADSGNPIYTSGLSTDQTTSDNPYLAFGLLKNTGNTMNYVLDNYLAGTLERGPITLGVKEDGFGVYHITEEMDYINTDIITDEVIAAGEAARDQIINGEIEVIAPSEE